MADINAKIKLDGAAAFKRDLAASKTAVSTLDKELKLAEQQFKDTGDAEDYMKTRGNLLNQKLQAQKTVLKSAQQGLDDLLKKGYEPNSKEVMTWRGRIADAATAIRETNREIDNNKKGLDKAGKAYSTTAGNVQGMSDNLDTAGDSARGVTTALKNIDKGVAFQNVSDALDKINGALSKGIQKAYDFGKKLWNLTSGATDWADELATQSLTTGIDAETLQRWEYAARFIDTEVDDIIKARNKLTTGMGKDDLGETLASNGIAVTDAAGNMRDAYDVMWDVLDLLGTMDNATERDNLAMEIFGKSASELLPLIKAGREEWEKTGAEAPIVSDENLKKLTSANDALQRMEANFEALKNNLLAELAPAMETVANSLSQAMTMLGEYLDTDEGKAKLQAFSDALVKLAEKALDIDWGKAIEAAGTALTAVTDALIWITDNWEVVVAALTAIAGVKLWGILASAATNVGKLTNGISTLLGGKTAAGAGGGAAAAGGSGTAAAGSGAAAGGKSIATKTFTPGLLSGGAEMLVSEGIVIAAAIGTAVAVQSGIEEKLMTAEEAAEEAADAIEAAGDAQTAALIRAVNEATGPQRDDNGDWKRNVFGFLNLNDTGESRDLLMGLQSRKNMELAQLVNVLQTYGETVAGTGMDPWTMLQRVWNPRLGKESWEEDWNFTEGELDALAQAIRDAYIQAGMAPEKKAETAASTEEEPGWARGTLADYYDELMALEDRKNVELAKLHNLIAASEVGEQGWADLTAFWQDPDSITANQADAIYRAVAAAEGIMLSKGIVLTREAETGNQNSTQGGVTGEEVAGMVASALSQTKFEIDGKVAGKAVAPTVAEILARENFMR